MISATDLRISTVATNSEVVPDAGTPGTARIIPVAQSSEQTNNNDGMNCLTAAAFTFGPTYAPTSAAPTKQPTTPPTSAICQDGFREALETGPIGNGHEQCQVGHAGGRLQFLFKDGNGCEAKQNEDIFGVTDGASCFPTTETSCTGRGNIGKECIWELTLPPAGTASSTSAATGTSGNQLRTCADQRACMDWSLEPLAGGQYRVCAKLNLGAEGCNKDAGETVSHTCVKDCDTTPTDPVSYTHLRAHETPEHLVCRLLLEKKKKKKRYKIIV
eukprot:TRINITY_DN331_c0_g2_i1.p1 TRINITY_DN331_c0_g2~~TRINITY_DN331_c0_g2_i1.p1  ORF type:complete len:273 (+),score=44.30 TRINITY_DN331_c0_g2_i1:351-1169(+)